MADRPAVPYAWPVGAICGLFGGAQEGMVHAMRRRGAVLWQARLGHCALSQLGARYRSWNGEVDAAGQRFAVVFEGDVFNLADLQRDLARKGRPPGAEGIADTLVALYL